MKKINKFLDTPLTWRRSLKATGIIMLLYIPFIVWYYVSTGLVDIEDLKFWKKND